MNLIQLDVSTILVLGVDCFYAVHPDGPIESFRVEGDKLMYFEEEEWVRWAPQGGVGSIKSCLEDYSSNHSKLKYYIKNEE